MEHNYLKTTLGKIHAWLVGPTLFLCFLIYAYEYAQGKNPVIWGPIMSLIGFLLFLKAKLSVIRKGKWVSFGCDLMDQTNTYFYFAGWVLGISGYFLSFHLN